jgi:hypothetical protein
MGKVKELYNKLKKLDFEKMCAEAVIENEAHIIDLNTGQLFQGERSDGSMLPDYSFVSVNFYNKPKGPIKLYDTGAFYSGFRLASKSGKAEFPMYVISTDEKSDELKSKYGSEIFGLTEENEEGFARIYLLPTIGKKLRNYLGV